MKTPKLLKRLVRRPPAKLRLARPVRVGIVGAGKAATYHLEALKGIEGAEPVFVVNRGNARASALAARFGVGRTFTDVDQALDAGAIDAAIVAVPAETVSPIVTRLFERGVPCLIEKPLGTSAAEARSLTSAAGHLPATCVGLNRRFLSSVRRAVALCNELPDLYAIHIEAPEPIERIHRENRFTIEDRRRWLMLNSIHAIDIFTLFAGPFADVLGAAPEMPFATQTGREDFTSLIRFANGMTGSYISHWHSPGRWRVDLFGKGFRLTLDLMSNTLTVLDEERKPQHFAPEAVDRTYKPGIYLQNFRFLEAVASGGTIESPMATPESAALSMALAEAIQSSGQRSQVAF